MVGNRHNGSTHATILGGSQSSQGIYMETRYLQVQRVRPFGAKFRFETTSLNGVTFISYHGHFGYSIPMKELCALSLGKGWNHTSC